MNLWRCGWWWRCALAEVRALRLWVRKRSTSVAKVRVKESATKHFAEHGISARGFCHRDALPGPTGRPERRERDSILYFPSSRNSGDP